MSEFKKEILVVIQCSHCQARFKLADDKIKPGGTKVRCAKCREIFTVNPGAAEEETPAPTIPDVTKSSQISPTDEFSFDIGDIAASTTSLPAPALTQDTNTFPSPEVSHDSPAVGISEYSNNDESTDGTAFSFDSSESEGDAFSFNNSTETAISIGIDTTSSATAEFGDDNAFSFDEAPSVSLPMQSASAPQTLASEAFGFGETNEVDTISFDASPPLAPQTEAFSFDSDQEAAGFGEFSFDDKPSEDNAQTDKFSFEQSGSNSEFSWDEAPATASLESSSGKTATQQPQGASEDFDFGSISFGDENPAPTITAPPLTTAPVPQKSPLPTDIGIAAPATPTVATADREREPSLPNKSQKSITSKATRPRPKPGSTISFGVVFKFLLVGVILGAGFFGYLYRDKLQTGYRDLISRLIEKQAPKEDQGEIILKAPSSDVVLNQNEGTLYVIRGEAVNGYQGLRSSIQVKAVLYGKQGEILQEQTAYCGNVLNDKILSKVSIAELKSIMANELGDSLTNMNIAAGKSVPYTIVFKVNPDLINEYTSDIEVIDSKPGAK